MKGQVTDYRKTTPANHISSKELASRIYRKHLPLNKMTKKSYKMGQRSEQTLHQRSCMNGQTSRSKGFTIVRKMYIKTTMRHHFILTRTALSNRKTSAGERLEKLEPLYAASQNAAHRLTVQPSNSTPQRNENMPMKDVYGNI